jgi:hypothetical protein
MEFIQHERNHGKGKTPWKHPSAACSRGVLILAVVLFVLAAFCDRAWAVHGDGGPDSGDKPALVAFDGSRRSGGSPADPGTGGNVAADSDATTAFTVVSADPPPEVTGLDPPFRWAGNGGFKLTVKGKNFREDPKVLWNGAERVTQYIDPAKLVATILSFDVLDPKTATVKVRNGDGQESNIVYYEVKQKGPAPKVTGLAPFRAWEGSGGFTLKVTGENFWEDAVVEWDGEPRETRYVNATELAATILSGDVYIDMAGKNEETKAVGVRNGDEQHDSMIFMVYRRGPAPKVTGLDPSRTWAGSGGFDLKVTGENFKEDSKVLWNGDPRTTKYESPILVATIPWRDILEPGIVLVTVENPDGGISDAVTFTVESSCPEIERLKPSAAKAGSGGFDLKVTGKNFKEGSKVRWNLSSRETRYDGETGELVASIPADDISRPNAVTVTVKNADGQESGGAAFTVMEAAGLEPPSPFVLPPPSRKVTTTEAVCVRGRYLSPITDVTVGRKDGGPCAITVRDVIVEDTSVCFTMVMPCDTEGGEHVIRLHYGQDEPQTLDVPMAILVARPPTPHP